MKEKAKTAYASYIIYQECNLNKRTLSYDKCYIMKKLMSWILSELAEKTER